MGEVVFHEEVDSQHLDYSALVLSAVCSADAFSYLVSDTGQKHLTSRRLHFDRRYHHFDRPLAYLGEVMRTEELLYEDFRVARFALRGTPFVSCNAATLHHANRRTLLRQTTHLAPTDEVCVDEIPGTDIRIIYAVTQAFREELALYFESATVCHAVSPLIWSALKRSRRDRWQMHVVANRGWLEIVVVADHSLKFANHFPWHAPEDILYYTTAILQELHLDASKLDLAVCGAASPDLATFLQRHLLPEMKSADSSHDVVEERLFDLLSVARCGL